MYLLNLNNPYKSLILKTYMNLVLINPDYMSDADPPIGLAYLAAYIKKKTDWNVRIFDQLSYSDTIKKIKELKPEVIGLTAVSSNYYIVKEIAKKLKKISPDSTLIIGGVHVTTSPESFNDSVFDIAVTGEGEIPFSRVLESIKQNKGIKTKELKKIKGIIFRENKESICTGSGECIDNLDEIPMPARDLLNMKYYRFPSFLSKDGFEPSGSMITSRGCPYNCKFCSSSAFWGRRIRFFSAKRVANEIETLYKKYKYRSIIIYDDLFPINKERLREITKLLKQRNLLGKIKFYVYGRADVFDEEHAQLLKKLNVVSITFGFETGSQKVLNYLKGGIISVKDNKKALDIARKYGFDVGGFFMVGSPYETAKDMKETYDFIKNNSLRNFSVYQTIAFPGTAIWNYAIENKIIDKDYYNRKEKDLVDFDANILLSRDISKKEFKKIYGDIKSLQLSTNKSNFLINLLSLRLRHVPLLLSPLFLKKAYNLRKQFIKRVFRI